MEGANNNGVTVSSFDAFLKQWYIEGDGLNRLMYESDPFLARLKRRPATTMVGGDEIIVPIRVGRSPTQSKNFQNAQNQAKQRTGDRRKWIMPVDDEYGVIRVSDKSILASKTNRGAFVQSLRDEADSCIEGVSQRRCTAIFSSKPGLAATIRTSSGVTVTLSLANQTTAFDIGDVIEFRVPATGALRPAVANPPTGLTTQTFLVRKVNRATGVLTLDRAPTSLAANDEVYRQGDYGVTSLTGLDTWIPKSLTSPALGTLHGIDRTLDPLRLAGHRRQMASASERFDNAIRTLCAQINQLTGKNPNIAVMSPLVENLVATEQQAQIRFDDAKGSGAGMMVSAGVGRLSVKTAKGEIELVSSAYCPTDTIYLLNESDLALYYLAEEGDDFVFFKKDRNGSIFQIAYDSAGFEARIESFGNLGMRAPGLHGRITLHSSRIPTIA